MTDHNPLADEMKRLAATRRGDEHPPPDTLLAYHLGILEGERVTALREHLAVCPQCARAVLDMAEFPDVEPRPGAFDPAEPGEREMAALEERIAALGPADDPAPTPANESVPRPANAPEIGPMRLAAPYLAAALVLVCLGLVWRLAVLDSKLGEARSSVARLEEALAAQAAVDHSFEIVSLQPIGAGEERGAAETTVFGSDRSFVPLVLNVYLRENGPYSVGLVDAAGKTWHRWSGIEPTSRKNLTLMLPPVDWPPGDYELRVTRPGDGSDAPPLARFPLEIGS